jgi:hypothetical protein
LRFLVHPVQYREWTVERESPVLLAGLSLTARVPLEDAVERLNRGGEVVRSADLKYMIVSCA